MRKKEKVSKVEIRSFSPTVNIIFNIVIALFAISCVLPFIFVVMISLTEEHSLAELGYRFGLKNFQRLLILISLPVK